jgi:outer membrane DcaP-like protein
MGTGEHQFIKLKLAAFVLASLYPIAAHAQKPTLEIYGFGQADAIADFKVNDPNWYDVNRPSKLPSFPGEFGRDGHFYLSPRQSRFGAKGVLPTSNGDVTAVFEFDMFGVGVDKGQTTIRLRHAYGQWKQVGAGQTNSQFMDVDVFPNILDYWGPNGMLFFRNTQVFWQFYKNGNSNAAVAIEAPGASGDSGLLSERIELQNIKPRFPAPDLTGHYRRGAGWGYVQLGGALRYIAWDDLLPNDAFNLNGHVWGWGVSLSSNIKFGADNVLRLQAIYGRGIENYFNDAPVDVGVERNPGNPVTPVEGEALPIFGGVAYLDHNWNSKWSTAVGYSMVDVNNSDLQAPTAFNVGRYASINLLCTPVKNVMIGGEFQWGQRKNLNDFTSNDYRVEFSFKYSFSAKVTGE